MIDILETLRYSLLYFLLRSSVSVQALLLFNMIAWSLILATKAYRRAEITRRLK